MDHRSHAHGIGVFMDALADRLRGVQLERANMDEDCDVCSVATSCVSVHPTTHARERQAERGVSKKQIQVCLKHGVVYEGRDGATRHVFGPTTVVVAKSGCVITAWGRPALLGVLTTWIDSCARRETDKRTVVLRRWRSAVQTMHKLEKREKRTQFATEAVATVRELLEKAFKQHKVSAEDPVNIARQLQKRQIKWNAAMCAIREVEPEAEASRLEAELEVAQRWATDAQLLRRAKLDAKRERREEHNQNRKNTMTRKLRRVQLVTHVSVAPATHHGMKPTDLADELNDFDAEWEEYNAEFRRRSLLVPRIGVFQQIVDQRKWSDFLDDVFEQFNFKPWFRVQPVVKTPSLMGVSGALEEAFGMLTASDAAYEPALSMQIAQSAQSAQSAVSHGIFSDDVAELFCMDESLNFSENGANGPFWKSLAEVALYTSGRRYAHAETSLEVTDDLRRLETSYQNASAAAARGERALGEAGASISHVRSQSTQEWSTQCRPSYQLVSQRRIHQAITTLESALGIDPVKRARELVKMTGTSRAPTPPVAFEFDIGEQVQLPLFARHFVGLDTKDGRGARSGAHDKVIFPLARLLNTHFPGATRMCFDGDDIIRVGDGVVSVPQPQVTTESDERSIERHTMRCSQWCDLS